MDGLSQEHGLELVPEISRRGFLKAAGLTTALLMMPSFLTGCGATVNPGATSMTSTGQKKVSTDVLVIGGGMAGAFAAIAARQQGLNVTLVDKGVVGRSGSTPWANGFAVFDEAQGDDREEWIAGVQSSSEYVNNLDWLDQVLDESKNRWEDIVSWGMTRDDVRHPSLVLREKLLESDVELIERTMVTSLLTQEGDGDGRVIGAMGFSLDEEEAITLLAKATIMCAGAGAFKAPGFPVHSLTSDGDAMAYRVGAIISGKEWVDFHFTYTDYPASCWNQWSGMWESGIGRTSGVFTAGMTLDGAFTAHEGLASVGGQTSTSDDVALMAAAVPEGESSRSDAPVDGSEGDAQTGPPSDTSVSSEGGAAPQEALDACEGSSEGDDCEFDAPMGAVVGTCVADGEQLACFPEGGPPERASGGPGEDSGPGGGAPPGAGGSGGAQVVLGAATGLGIHKAEGIWPTSMQGACNVPGLFAAGDGLASMLCGASYVGIGMSLSGSAVQGVVVGQGAAEYALQAAEATLSDDEIASVQAAMFAPRERETGFTPAWVTQVLQNTMFPYFVLMVKKEDRLQAALSTVTFLRENMVPHLVAQDAHELRLAHETANMLLNAEMKLRASLFRTESRGTHYREDYPARDDENWLAWVLMQMGSDGQMTVTKQEIPDDWKPDMTVPYEERYTNRFPGELEYLGLA